MVVDFRKLWQREPLMKRVIARFGDIILEGESIFIEAWDFFNEHETIDRIPQSIYDKDIAINNHEREIRRLLVEHLSLHPRYDTSGALAMMSLVKDAERIGDYAKNIAEVGVLYKGVIKEMRYFTRLSDIQQRISAHFPVLKKAFIDSDEKLAKRILQNYIPIKKECDKILYDIFEDELSPYEAVATAMISRYLKRINSHVCNIASGIIYPLDQIDFVQGDILE